MRLPTLLILASCTSKEGTDTSQPPAKCKTEVSSTRPEDGAVDAFYRDDIEFQLSEADASATFTVNGPAGAVTGTQVLDGDIVTFTPAAPLDPATTYTASLELCDGERQPTITFTTTGIGPPVESLEGLTFALDLANAEIIQPEGIGPILLQVLTASVLLGITSDDGTTLQMMGALSEAGPETQDTCIPSIVFPEADFSENPYFSVGPGDAAFEAMGYEVTIFGLYVTGAFAPDASYVGGGTLLGELDARELAVVLAAEGMITEPDPEQVCGLVAGFGATCGACGSDGEPYCLVVEARKINGELVDGETLVVIEESDCHEECAASCENAECPEAADWSVCG